MKTCIICNAEIDDSSHPYINTCNSTEKEHMEKEAALALKDPTE